MKTADETAKVTEEKATETKEEQAEVMKAAGAELEDGELDSVTGGATIFHPLQVRGPGKRAETVCHTCGHIKSYNRCQYDQLFTCGNPNCAEYKELLAKYLGK